MRMQANMKKTLVVFGLALFLLPALVPAETMAIPSRPEELTYPELHFDVPKGDDYRHELKNGVVVYVATDRALPLVNVAVTLRLGSFLEPADKVGLAALTGTMMRQGGTASFSAEELDEKLEFLAANVSSNAGDTQGGANLNCITQVLDESLGIFFEMLRAPRFEEDRLKIEKDSLLEEMKQRNDDAGDIQRREWGWLLLGDDYFGERRMTKANLDAITRQDLIDFHRRYWRPENMIVAVSGDVEAADILKKLEAELGKWEGRGDDVPWPPPLPDQRPVPGVYHVEKDIPQGKVSIGHLTKQWDDWDDPDLPALQVMNFILGGSGFTSRITSRVRSDEGLAYSAGSRIGFDPFRPADFTIFYQSKSPTVALAAKIAIEEMRRIQAEPVTAEELKLAKSSLIETFPRRFESPRQVVGTYSYDTYIGRSHEYWQNWRQRIGKVTAEDVERVAKKYLKPDEVVFLVVGKWDDIAPGDADNRASMKDFFGGEVTHLPLRDPMTLEPLP